MQKKKSFDHKMLECLCISTRNRLSQPIFTIEYKKCFYCIILFYLFILFSFFAAKNITNQFNVLTCICIENWDKETQDFFQF